MYNVTYYISNAINYGLNIYHYSNITHYENILLFIDKILLIVDKILFKNKLLAMKLFYGFSVV